MAVSKQIRSKARRLFRLCITNGLLDEARVRQVVRRIRESRRRDSLALLSYLWRLVKVDRFQHSAEVQSAAPLPTDLQARVQSSLELKYGKGISTSFVLRPDLLGGMRVKVGSDVYDGSVRTRLDALQGSL